VDWCTPPLFQSLGRDSVHSSWVICYGLGSARRFQSLGRDSVHSSQPSGNFPEGNNGVSIPRSGFCSFKPVATHFTGGGSCCFNPSVGILFIQAGPSTHTRPLWRRFNPSVGILFIQAALIWNASCGIMRFQSLGRDSVHSSGRLLGPVGLLACVSIPRSGFCSFKLLGRIFRQEYEAVSIPRSGFCSFKQKCLVGYSNGFRWFQSLGRDSVHSSEALVETMQSTLDLQSLGRDSVHSSRDNASR